MQRMKPLAIPAADVLPVADAATSALCEARSRSSSNQGGNDHLEASTQPPGRRLLARHLGLLSTPEALEDYYREETDEGGGMSDDFRQALHAPTTTMTTQGRESRDIEYSNGDDGSRRIRQATASVDTITCSTSQPKRAVHEGSNRDIKGTSKASLEFSFVVLIWMTCWVGPYFGIV